MLKIPTLTFGQRRFWEESVDFCRVFAKYAIILSLRIVRVKRSPLWVVVQATFLRVRLLGCSFRGLCCQLLLSQAPGASWGWWRLLSVADGPTFLLPHTSPSTQLRQATAPTQSSNPTPSCSQPPSHCPSPPSTSSPSPSPVQKPLYTPAAAHPRYRPEQNSTR